MALTSITKDFVVKAGLTVEGTGTVTSSTGASSALQVNGGASIAKNLIVGTTATVYGPASFLNTLNATGQSTFNALTATSFTATSAHIINTAAVDVGVITPVVTSTSQLILSAGGTTNDVEIQTNGHATQFLAAGQIRPSGMLMGSSYDSNQVDVSNVGPLLLKGLVYGVQLTTSPDQGTTNYNWAFDTSGNLTNPGRVIVQSSQASTSTLTGALTVSGGVGIGGDLYVGGSITAHQLTVAYTTVTQSLVTSPDVFTITNTTISISTISGALVVAGGVGIGGSIYIGADLKAQTLTARALATATNNLVYADSNGQLQITPISFSGGTINGTVTYANTATNLSGGTVGSLPYQTSAGTTTMLPIGSNLQVLTVSGGVPVWADASGTTVGNASNAVTATNIAYGLANEIPYQQSPGITTFNSGFTFNGTIFTATNISVPGTTNAISTLTGALQVAGGVGIQKDLYIGGNINVGGTTSRIISNAGTFNTLAVTGTNVAFTVTNSAYIGQNLQVGGIVTATTLNVTGQSIIDALTATITTVTQLTVINNASVGGVFTATGHVTLEGVTSTGATGTGNIVFSNAPTFTGTASMANVTASGTLSVTGESTLGAVTATVVTATSLTVSGQSILGALTATIFTATSINVSGNETIGGTLGVTGQSTLGALTATTFTATTANIISNETVGGILTVNTTTDSTLTTNGSIVTAGGVGIAKNVIVGGAITIGSSISSSTVASIYSNNSVYASFTSNVISNNSQQLLDSFVSDTYRTAKYLVQIVDTTGNKIHVEEILLFHDGASVYMNEYAIATNTGELGTFDATFGGGYVTLTFTPNYTPGYMTIKVNRTAITK